MNLLKISALIFVIGITLLSLLPAKSVMNITIYDKLGHALAYFVIMINIGLFTSQHKYFLLLVLVVGYSGLIELCQGFVPGRSVTWQDVVANFIGASLGLIVLLVFKKILLKCLNFFNLVDLSKE